MTGSKSNSTLVFPKLVFVRKDVMTKAGWDEKQEVNIYNLDWTAKEQKVVNKILKSMQFEPNSYIYKRVTDYLPDSWDGVAKRFEFALPPEYLSEIRRMCTQADTEWNRELPFDTLVRDWCAAPAVAFVMTAFKLLCDCLYDNSTKYYNKRGVKPIAANLLCYKFWRGQTGSGLVADHADWHRVIYIKDNGRTDEDKSFARALYDDINNFEEAIRAGNDPNIQMATEEDATVTKTHDLLDATTNILNIIDKVGGKVCFTAEVKEQLKKQFAEKLDSLELAEGLEKEEADHTVEFVPEIGTVANAVESILSLRVDECIVLNTEEKFYEYLAQVFPESGSQKGVIMLREEGSDNYCYEIVKHSADEKHKNYTLKDPNDPEEFTRGIIYELDLWKYVRGASFSDFAPIVYRPYWFSSREYFLEYINKAKERNNE